MKTKYQYIVECHDAFDGKKTFVVNTREEARDIKRSYYLSNTKIIQRKYVLAEEKVVR